MEIKEFIRLENISKTYPGVKALDGVSISIRYGEVHALVGENGAGKSTLIKLLAGVEKPEIGGEFYINNSLLVINNPIDSIKQGISVIYQDISLFPNLSIAENICIGKLSKNTNRKIINWKQIRNIAKSALAEIDIKMDVNEKLENLSIAKQQIVAIARAVYFDSSLI